MANPFTVRDQNTVSSRFVDAMRVNDESALRTLYENNFKKVETMILKNNGTSEQAKDIFQEAFIAVWKNVHNNKFSPGNEKAINGYLYTIAKNKWMDYLRSPAYKKRVSFHTVSETNPARSVVENDNLVTERETRLALAMKAFENLGEACRTLLVKFYFEKKTMKEIAEELQLDAASTRNKKYRCMQALRGLAQEMNT